MIYLMIFKSKNKFISENTITLFKIRNISMRKKIFLPSSDPRPDSSASNFSGSFANFRAATSHADRGGRVVDDE